MMPNKVLLSLATVALFAATAKAYTVETTTNWFSVVAADVSLTDNWGPVKPTRGDEATVIDVDTSAAAPAKYTPPAGTKPSATRYRVTGYMTVTLNAAVPGNNVFGETLPKAALVAVDDSGTSKWYAWHLTDANHGEWNEMSGHTPEEGETYAITIEFTSTTVSYTVGVTTLGTAESSGETKTLDNTSGGLSIASVGLAGYGSFGNFGVVGYEEFEVTVPAEKLSVACEAMGITGDITPAKLNEKGTNGLTKWESIVLGLKSASTKPYTAPVQTSGNTLGFTIGNAEIGKYSATGATVAFDVYECSADGTVSGDSQATGNADNGYTATVAPDPGSVKYYKIKVKITK